MKWRCALIQKRWLPAYPGGDLPSFWRERLRTHLQGCPACREELAGLEAVIRTVQAAPPPDPAPAFWENFHRELHVKLAQSVPAPPPPRFFKMPYYLLGAPALAALLIWVAVGYLNPERPGLAPQHQISQQEKTPEKMAAYPRVAAPAPEATEAVVFVAQNDQEMPPDDDLEAIGGNLDATLAGMTETEREAFLKRLRQHEKDGSCTRKSFAIFWA